MRYIAKTKEELHVGERCAAFGATREYIEAVAASLNTRPDDWGWLVWQPWAGGGNYLGAVVDLHDSWHKERAGLCECAHETCPCARETRRRASMTVDRGGKHLRVCGRCELTGDTVINEPALELTEQDEQDVDAWKDRKAARARHHEDLRRIPPTDAEIVEHMEARARLVDYGAPVMRDYLQIRGHEIAMADVRAAWSRELKRKQAEAREQDRQRVICEDQYEL